MEFIANLRTETIDAFLGHAIQPAGYLLSAHRVTPATLAAAERVRAMGLPLIADNGTGPLIDHTVALFRDRARDISHEVHALRRELGHVPTGKEVPDSVRVKAQLLAQEVVAHTIQVSQRVDTDNLVQLQMAMNPTDLIAQEDFATACLIGLSLEREITRWPIARFDARNRRSVDLWERVKERVTDDRVRVYGVLSAMDYNTARSAGRLAADRGVQYVALGMAAINRDASATDFFVMGTATLKLEAAAPRRYVRLAATAQGIMDGFAERGAVLRGFHCLGLGAPALFPIVAAAVRSEALTTDATSPIHDAVRDRVLYDPENDGSRETTVKIAQTIVRGGVWPFLSPFSVAFRHQFGHDPERARQWWSTMGNPAITSDHLRTPNDLSAALPLFADADDVIRIDAQKTRIAHNHWVVDQLTRAFPDGPARSSAGFAAIKRLTANGSLVTSRGLTASLTVLRRAGLTEH
jgi:hypothetical protein